MKDKEIINGYIEAMFFTEGDSELKDSDSSDLAPETMTRIIEDCFSFYVTAEKFFDDLPDDYDYYGMGSDFWFTRNGHGVGFWDRLELKENGLGDKLSEVSREFGNIDAYIGDDGLIYLV